MEIEVKHSDFYVEALVLNISDTKFEVNYDGMSESSGWVDFEYCRARIDPSEDKAKILKVKVGDVVDAYVSYQDDRKAWRKMKIQSIKDRRAVVHRVDDTKMTETIPIQHCRHPKLSMQITPSSIQTRKFALDDLFEFFKQNEQHYKVLHDSVPGLLIKLEDEGKQLVIKALTQSIISKVDMLMAFFFDNSRQKLGLIKKQKWLKEFVREPIIDAPCIIEFEFDVLLGRQIDSNGGDLKDALAAIKKIILVRMDSAKVIEGIKKIALDHTACDEGKYKFKIFADTMDAAGSARNMLEIFHRVEFASKEIVKYIIGEGGHNIQKIVHESDVLRVVIGGEDLDGFVPFTFIGTREALNLAAFLFSFNVKQFSMLEDFEQYDPIKLLEKAEYYYNLKPADLVQCSHKLWLSCVFSVKRLFLIYGICIKSHKTLTTFCNYAIVCSLFDPATKGRLFDGWLAGGYLHSFTYATGLRKSTFDYYMEMVKFFVINFGKITTNHILPDLSEFLKQHNGFKLRLEEGNCLIGGRLYDYDTAAYTN